MFGTAVMPRTKFLRPRLLFALLLGMVLMAGCGFGPPQVASAPQGTLRWSLEGVSDITRLDPAQLADYQSNIAINLIFGGLVKLNERLEVVGEGAERWDVSSDGRVYTFYLRKNLAYGDGTPAKAEDFAAALARTLAPDTGTAFALAFLDNIVGAKEVHDGTADQLSGVKVIDDQTLEITLDSPRGYFLSQLTYGLSYVVPPGKIEAAKDDWVGQAFGTGPFRVKERLRGEKLILEGNPHYWAGLPGVANLELIFAPDTETAFQNYKAGDLDVMGSIQAGIPADRIDEVRGRSDVKTVSAPVVRYIGFNNARPPFNNVYVRQAFAQSVDKEALARQVLDGAAVAAQRILPQGFPGSDVAIEPLDFDPVGARSALGLAGYVSGSSLPQITLTYATGDRDTAAVASAVQQNWRETLGINVSLDPVPVDTLIERLNAMAVNPSDATAMQMYLSVWGADYPDPHNFLSLQLHSASPYNNGHWSNPQFDTLTDQADQLLNARRAERFDLYRNAEQIALNEVGWLPLYNPQVSIFINNSVRGLVFTATPQGIIAPDWTKVQIVTEK